MVWNEKFYSAIWCIQANQPKATPKTNEWLCLILQHSLITKKNPSKKFAWVGHLNEFWPRKSGMRTNQSSKVQMPGRWGWGEWWSLEVFDIQLKLKKDIRDVNCTLTVFFLWLLGEKRQVQKKLEWVCNKVCNWVTKQICRRVFSNGLWRRVCHNVLKRICRIICKWVTRIG